MVDTHRGIVTAWDERNQRPKGVTTPADMRLSLASIARAEGIMAETGAAQVSLPNTRMAIAWTAFTAVITSPRGGWLCPRIEAGEVALAVGSTSFPRIDVVWVRHWDYEADGSHPDSEVEVGVTRGTPSSTPRVPTIPSGALAVFTVTVPRGATVGSDIPVSGIERCRWTTPVGGILTAADLTEATRFVSGVPASAANPVYVQIGGVLRAWDGTTWRPVGGEVSFESVGDIALVPLDAVSGAQVVVKTGSVSAFTTDHSYGNGYLPMTWFTTPFPSRVLSVQVTPVYKNSGAYPATSSRPPFVDTVSRTGFRVMYPGETSPAVHSVMWTAIGC